MYTKRIASLLLVLVLVVGAFSACNTTEPTPSSTAPVVSSEAPVTESPAEPTAPEPVGEPVQMEWLVGQTSAEVNDDAEVVKMIEERFNIDLKAWYVDSNNFQENLNVKFAGGEMPDVLVIDNVALLPNYVNGGIVHELPIERIREQAPNYAAAADANDDGTLWSSLSFEGANYGATQPMDAVPMAMFWRQDWLKTLNLEAPTTIEEYEAVLTAFVENDPDGDGVKNTAGMAERAFGAIFGAYGMRIVTGGGTGFKVEELQLGKDNVPFFPVIRPEAKAALTTLASWYQKGLIDKEFITGENHGGYTWLSHSFMNDRIGLTSAQPYHYLNASTDTANEANWGVCMKELKALNPDADIFIGQAPIGPNGDSGTEGWNLTGRFTVLTTKAFDDERKVDAFLAMMDAYYSDMDYAKLVNYGLEGVHFEQTEEGPIRIMEGTDLRKDGVLQVDFGNTVPFSKSVTPEKNAFGHAVTGNGYYRFNAPPVVEFSDVIATLDTLTEQAYYDIITGVQPIEYFDTFVEEFKAAGGETAEKAIQEAHALRIAG